MKTIATTFLLSSVSVATLGGCGDDPSPSIEIVSVASTTLHATDDALDDLVVRLRYFDADGDLGGGEVVVHDCRDAAFASRFPIDPIASRRAVEEGSTIAGELVVTVADVELLPAATRPDVCAASGAPSTAFCVTVEDVAGNVSEPACTEPITVD